jgi:hypothetical protein
MRVVRSGNANIARTRPSRFIHRRDFVASLVLGSESVRPAETAAHALQGCRPCDMRM